MGNLNDGDCLSAAADDAMLCCASSLSLPQPCRGEAFHGKIAALLTALQSGGITLK